MQACSDDPLVAFHAVRNLARLGMGVVEHKWMELGFGRTSSTTSRQATPRNLLGFKDGTRNIKAEQRELMDDYVWVGAETDQRWLRGGSYLVARKIRMFIENWDRDTSRDQENTIGRTKLTGAPLSGGTEFTTAGLHGATATATRHPGPTRTSGWRAPSTTPACTSCAAATRSPTASILAPARCSAGCSSSRS